MISRVANHWENFAKNHEHVFSYNRVKVPVLGHLSQYSAISEEKINCKRFLISENYYLRIYTNIHVKFTFSPMSCLLRDSKWPKTGFKENRVIVQFPDVFKRSPKTGWWPRTGGFTLY